MVKFIHSLTGTNMWVVDERAAEYEAAGYKRAASPSDSSATVNEGDNNGIRKNGRRGKRIQNT